MILLYGISEDSPMSMVRDELNKAAANYLFLDHRNIFNYSIEFSCSEDGADKAIINAPGISFDLSEVSSVYTRPYNFMDYPQMQGRSLDDPTAVTAMGFEHQFMLCLDTSNAFVVNRSEPSASNNSKPYQLSVIREVGLNIPETFITNEPLAAAQFIKTNADCVYKSVSGVRSIVRRVSESHYEYLDDVKWCPTLFQKFVPGENYRVHVVKGKVFTVRIESDNLDYRYGKTRMFVEELPSEIAEKCCTLTAALGLYFSGIDLMKTPDNDWYCFEANSSPAYSYFELHSGLKISTALAEMLMNPGEKN